MGESKISATEIKLLKKKVISFPREENEDDGISNWLDYSSMEISGFQDISNEDFADLLALLRLFLKDGKTVFFSNKGYNKDCLCQLLMSLFQSYRNNKKVERISYRTIYEMVLWVGENSVFDEIEKLFSNGLCIVFEDGEQCQTMEELWSILLVKGILKTE